MKININKRTDKHLFVLAYLYECIGCLDDKIFSQGLLAYNPNYVLGTENSNGSRTTKSYSQIQLVS